MESDDILEFLPIYSNIQYDEFSSYDNFNRSNMNKKEFNEEMIGINEVPNNKEKLFKAQKFIMKFLSSFTPYDQILLFHEMGVGKSRAAISAIENIKQEIASKLNDLRSKKENMLLNFGFSKLSKIAFL